jgi:hypothetical protein
MATYHLPFDLKVRSESHRRYLLVRDPFGGPKPFVLRRSDRREVLERVYDSGTDYLIDTVTREVTFHFNGHREVFTPEGV